MSQLIHYNSEDNIAHCLHAFTSDQNGPSSKPLVLLFPAMGVKASYYFKIAKDLNNLGIHFACTDLRGNDPMQHPPSRKNDFGYYEMINQDWPAAVKACKDNYPDSPIYIMGHSLGGQISACYATKEPNINGMILVASGNTHYKNFKNKRRVLIASKLANIMSQLFGYLPGNKIGFAGIEAKSVIRDWAYTIKTGYFRTRYNGEKEIYNLKMSQVKIPIMAISFDGDKLSPHAATQALLDLFQSAPKLHVKTSSVELKIDQLNHFNWARNFSTLADKIHQWIKKNG